MVPKKRKKTGSSTLSVQKMFGIIMQEIITVRRELKDEIAELRGEVRAGMGGLRGEIGGLKKDIGTLHLKVTGLESEFRGFRIEVHQNQIMFMNRLDGVEKRVTVLEAKAA